jgi:hypothetical protein
MYKNIGASKKPWSIQKHWHMLKPWRIQKHWRMTKPWVHAKTLAHGKN